jgi:hypothetical protein
MILINKAILRIIEHYFYPWEKKVSPPGAKIEGVER